MRDKKYSTKTSLALDTRIIFGLADGMGWCLEPKPWDIFLSLKHYEIYKIKNQFSILHSIREGHTNEMCMDFFGAKLKCVYEHNETTLNYCRERSHNKFFKICFKL